MNREQVKRDRGMTLVELIVVVAILGGVIVVLAATFVTILRITPRTEYRIDDARSTRGLQTWLVRDIASTPPQIYDATDRVGFLDADESLAVVPAGVLCTTTGTHVIFMAWEDSGVSYRSQYTIEGSASTGFKIVRTVCGGTTATISITGDISNSGCPSQPKLSELVITDADGDLVDEAVVEFCFVSAQSDAGISDGTQSQEITLSIASRNGDT